MDEFGGTLGNWHEGVFFTEGTLRCPSHPLGPIRVEISRQNSNLSEVKTRMAREATRRGANVIQNFTYGQKAHKWYETLFALTFKWDTESWHGSGHAVRAE